MVAVERFEDDVANINSEPVDNIASTNFDNVINTDSEIADDVVGINFELVDVIVREIVGGLTFVVVPLIMKTPKFWWQHSFARVPLPQQ